MNVIDFLGYFLYFLKSMKSFNFFVKKTYLFYFVEIGDFVGMLFFFSLILYFLIRCSKYLEFIGYRLYLKCVII